MKYLPLLLLAVLLLSAAGQKDEQQQFYVVSLIPPYQGLSDSLTQGRVKAVALFDSDSEMHNFQITPDKVQILRSARVYLSMGFVAEKEQIYPLLSENARVIELAEAIEHNPANISTIREYAEQILGETFDDEHSNVGMHDEDDDAHAEDEHGHDEDDDHHGEDEHGYDEDDDHHGEDEHGHDDHEMILYNGMALDTHFWLSTRALKKQLPTLSAVLSELQPAYKDFYTQRTAELLQEIELVEQKISLKLAPLSGSTVVQYHQFLSYYLENYGIKSLGITREGREVSLADIELLRELEPNLPLKTLFFLEEDSRQNVQIIASRLHWSIMPINPLSADWLANLEQIAVVLSETSLS